MTNGTSFDGLGRVTGRSMSTTTAGTVATFVRDYAYHAPTGLVDRLRAGWNNGTSTVWFADDTITRDAVGRVTQVVDNGVEPDSSPSAVKECFVYDHQHRLVRAHTATPATRCATSTTTASVAPGSRDPYDTVWAFDDLQRITSRTNQMTAATTTYQYGGVGPHAVTGLTGATTASYSYNPVGEMVDRDGTTLVWDPLGRLTVNGTTTSIYGPGPERLIHTAGSTRTLTLPGIDVVDQAGVRTVTRQVTLARTLVALAAGGQVWWNCANLSNTITCQTPAATTLTPPIPARKRFGPYGTARNGTVFAHTDRGYLGAPHDTTGLVHLQHRHLDPHLGTFISVDPLVGTTRQPYLYANGNPTTLSDPTGLEPACSARSQVGVCAAEHRAQRTVRAAPPGKVWEELPPSTTLPNSTCGAVYTDCPGQWVPVPEVDSCGVFRIVCDAVTSVARGAADVAREAQALVQYLIGCLSDPVEMVVCGSEVLQASSLGADVRDLVNFGITRAVERAAQQLGASCDGGPGGLIVCVVPPGAGIRVIGLLGDWTLPPFAKGGTTYGNVFVTDNERVFDNAELLRHELEHTYQWAAAGGLPFGPLYLAEQARVGGNPCFNRFEIAAGLAGVYRSC